MLLSLLTLTTSAVAAFVPHASAVPAAHRAAAAVQALADADSCELDEPALECAVRRQVDGPWADTWAKFVLLRPGMTYRELKKATQQRNRLDPAERIPGTYRTVFITHAICFLVAIPAVLTSDAVFPKLIEAAAVGRVMAKI